MKRITENTVLFVALILAIVLVAGSASARVAVHFTSARRAAIDEVIVDAFQTAEQAARRGEDASIDIAVFSFTTVELADELLRIAAENPTVNVRLLTDLSQLSQSQNHMSPYIEFAARADYRNACKSLRGHAKQADCRDKLATLLDGAQIDNVDVCYKYYNAYVYGRGGRVVLEHRLSRLMHHKAIIVNGETLVTGSYNFSPTARNKNYENMMVFSGSNERTIVGDFAAEFQALWSDNDRVLPGDDVREWRRDLISQMYQALEE